MDRNIGYIFFAILISALSFGLFACEDEDGGGGGGGGGLAVEIDQTQCKNVGFGVQTQAIAVATGGGQNLTYEWEFAVGAGGAGEWPGGEPSFGVPHPVLSGADTETVSFTTFTIEETLSNLNRGLRDRFEVLPFSSQEINYVLDVKVRSGNKEAEAGIVCTSAPSYGGWQNEYIPTNFDPETDTLPFRANTHLGLPVYFNGSTDGGEQTMWNWSITSAPAGSSASIVDSSSRTPHFVPDVVGDYVIAESVSDKSFTVSVSEWLGATAAGLNCQACHSISQERSDDGRTLTPKFEAWMDTGHATFFQRSIDGQQSPSYNEGCIRCHTVGYNLGNTIFNNGFDDVQELVGWTFPDMLMAGNFAAIPEELQVLGNIQCENCHGPGMEHAQSGGDPDEIIVNYTANDCAQCHDEPPYHERNTQWNNSPHSKFVTTQDLGISPLGEDDPALRGSCANCHTTSGNVIWIRSGGTPDDLGSTAPPADFAEPQTCTACHDPHNEAGLPSQVRRFGSFQTVALYTTPESVGKGATCIGCHNSRRSISTPSVLTSQNDAHAALQGDIFLGENLWFEGDAPGAVYPNSPHSTATENACVDCHMAATPPRGSPERNLVGDHTHLVSNDETGFENIGQAPTAEPPSTGSGCLSAGCHATSADGFEFDLPHTYGDFNGNGIREGVQTEVEGLLEALGDAIGEFAVDAGWDAGCPTQGKPTPVPFHGRVRLLCQGCTIEQAETDDSCFTQPAGEIPDADIYKASFNFLALEEDKSEGVHNTAFAVTALRTSYEQVAGVSFSGDPYPHAEDWDGIHPAVVEQDNVARCVGCHFAGNPYGATFPAPFPLDVPVCSSCHQ
jgi:hypothetical protein